MFGRAVELDQDARRRRPGRRRRGRSSAGAIASVDVARPPSGRPCRRSGLVAVAQLDGLVGAGRGARRHGGAADGAVARGSTSTSRVGLPRESRISRASTAAMMVLAHLRLPVHWRGGPAARRCPAARALEELERGAATGADMGELSVSPCSSTAATESPPPTTTVAPSSALSARKRAMARRARGQRTGSRRPQAVRSRRRSWRAERRLDRRPACWPTSTMGQEPGSSRPARSCTRCRG